MYLFLKLILIISFLYPQNANQIKEVKQLLKDSGISGSQAKEIAKSQGYTEKQIDATIESAKNKSQPSKSATSDIGQPPQLDLQTRNSFDKNKKTQNISEGSELYNNEEKSTISDTKSDELVDPEDFQIESQNPNTQQLDLIPYFGYDIFNGDPALFQSTTIGVVDPNYTIGPGDEIIVMLWGETEFRQVFSVNREGFIFLPDVGQIFVNGLKKSTVEPALQKRKRIIVKFSR